mmetsp:Transcript_59105/g.127279  ORF Transcript_59105/g.127279 Transcript_59105/m.127279 type:complete len:467 (-) Transcript_59105:418-1818(-)
MNSQHPLGLGVERNLEHLRVLLLVLHAVVSQDPSAGLHDRNLRGRSSHHPFAIRLGGVVQDTTLRQAQDRRVRHRCRPFRPGASASGKSVSVGHDVSSCHASRSQSPGLVRTQHAHAAQGLDGVDLADQHLLLHHAGGSDHQTDGHCGQQSFGDLSEESSGRILQDQINGPLDRGHQVGHQRQNTDGHGHISDDMHEVLNLRLQRRPGPGTLRHSLIDLPQERVITRRKHNALHLPLQHGGSKEANVVSLMDCHAFPLNLHGAGLRQRLSSQSSVVHLSALRAENDANVRRNLVAGLQHHQLTRHQITGLDPGLLHHLFASLQGVAVDAHQLSPLHILQRLHHGFSLQLRPPLQRSRRHDHHREEQWGQNIIADKDHGQRHLTSHTDPQHDVEQTTKHLLEQHQKNVFLQSWRQLILPKYKQVLRSLVHGQPSAFPVVTTCRRSNVSVEHACQFFSPERMGPKLRL